MGNQRGNVSTRRLASDRAFGFFRGLVLVYGGFLLGILTHAWWVGDADLVFWPWSAVFLVLLIGLVVWQRRRSVDVGSGAPQGPAEL